jgi:hypothetical protein
MLRTDEYVNFWYRSSQYKQQVMNQTQVIKQTISEYLGLLKHLEISKYKWESKGRMPIINFRFIYLIVI